MCLYLLAFAFQDAAGQLTYRQLREKMVVEQLQERDIYEASVLKAMGEVPRHVFVPEDYRTYAYQDQALPIGEGQTISQPYIVAYMTQALRLQPEDRVLEIGTGSGYQAAVLSLLTRQVFTIEIVEPLALAARERLKKLGYDNVAVHVGDGYNGWPSQAPFDAIMVTAGAEQLPQPLMDQLADGGRMIIPIGPHGGVRQLTLVTKRKGKYRFEKLMPVRFVPFIRKSKEEDR